jgi:proline iminopeptidase
MKRRFKIMIGSALVLLVVGGAGAAYVGNMMNKPLYEPGMVRAGQNLRASLTPPTQSQDAHFWNVESDIRLYHYAVGQGRHVLVVHGGPGYPDLKAWAGLEALTTRYQFNYYDQRGCGQSSRPIDRFASPNYYENMTTMDKTLGLGAQIADIERIRRLLGDERLILIGHSWGGFMASLYAAEFPEHVAALILVAPANTLVMPQQSGGLYESVRQHLPTAMQAEYAAYLKDYLDFQSLFTKSEATLVALNTGFAKYYAAASAMPIPPSGKSGGWMVQAMYFSMGKSHDYRAALQKVTAPVLVIHGADDLQTQPESQVYADAFPNARLQVIDRAAHFPFEQQPQQFAALSGEFLDSVK